MGPLYILVLTILISTDLEVQRLLDERRLLEGVLILMWIPKGAVLI